MVPNQRPLEGIVPVVQTPLTRYDQIDTDGLWRLIEFLVRHPIGGLWVLGTGSEDHHLTFEQRMLVAKCATAANAGRVPLILGAGFFSPVDCEDFLRLTSCMQCDAYHVMPYHPVMGLDGVEAMYRAVADSAAKPVWIYTSANWCRHFPPGFIARLKAHPNIAGVKFSSSSTADQMQAIAMAEPGFQVITAVAGQLVASLAMGARASTSSWAGALPEPLIEIHALWKAGRHQEALKAQHAFNRFTASLPKRPKEWNFLTGAYEKYILFCRGICWPYMTTGYTDLTSDEMRQVDECLAAAGYDRYLEPVKAAA